MDKTSLESETLARYTSIRYGNSGDPTGLFLLEEYGVQAIKSKETKCCVGSRIAA
ncbi:hypothetical protein ABLO26_25535 [Neobacillus sp. 179-J 1A1 HS]